MTTTGNVLAIDQGTSGTKALVIAPDRGVIASAEVSIRPRYGDGGLVEQDPSELLASVVEAGRQALESCGETKRSASAASTSRSAPAPT